MLAEVIERYTYEDYKLWEGDWELIDGVPVSMAPSPVKNHQMLVSSLLFELYDGLKDCEECDALSELDYIIDSENVVRPDVAVICNEDSDFITKAPKIIAEVISPSTSKRDEKVKFEIYQKEGVRYYILVYPQTLTAKVFRLVDEKYKKEGVFSREKYSFEFDECKVEVDFFEVFKKFIK